MRLLAVGLLVVLLAGCGGSNGAQSCLAGETQECLCVGGGEGVQICEPEGNAWGECQGCTSGDAADAAPADLGDQAGDPAPPDIPGPDGADSSDWSEMSDWSEVSDSSETSDWSEMSDSSETSDWSEMSESSETSDWSEMSDPSDASDLCTPSCADKECGDDGCGGLCNGCLDLVYDDGTTETAYGYSSEPDHKPTKIACVVRFDLPQANMRLVQFAAGWMYGLYALQIPFELGYVVGADMSCEPGTEEIWYNEWCMFTPDEFTKIGDFLPLEPYKAMKEDLLGEVILPAKTIYMVTLFTIDEYPIYVCPVDQSGNGALAYMMSEHKSGQITKIDGPSFDQKDGNEGVVPFRIRVKSNQ